MERLDGGFTLIWVKDTIFEETINCEKESRLKGMFIFWGQKGVRMFRLASSGEVLRKGGRDNFVMGGLEFQSKGDL